MTSTGVDRVEGVDPSVAIKAPCVVATTGNITLSGAQTIDGVAVSETSNPTRVLVRAQTDSTENGVYDVKGASWTRSEDFNGNRDVVKGTLISIQSGTQYAGATFKVTTDDPIVIGASNITLATANATDVITVVGTSGVDTYAKMRGLTSSFYSDGDVIKCTGDGTFGDYKVGTGSVSDDAGEYLVFNDDPNRFMRRQYSQTNVPSWFDESFSSDIRSGISACVDVNGIAEIGSGTFISATKEDFQPQRTYIKGQGHSTTIQINQSSDHTAFRVAAVGNSDRSHTRFSSLNFTSAGSSAGIATAIDAQAVFPIYCDDLSFFDVGPDSLKYYQCYYGGFQDCTWWDSGIDFTNVNNVNLSNFDFHVDPSSVIYSAGDYVVELKDCDSIVFDTGTFECQIASALVAYESKNITFRNTWFEANKDAHVLKFYACENIDFEVPYIEAPTGSQPSSSFIVVDPTRQHDGSNNASVLTDTKRGWVTNSQVGQTVYNVTDGSSGTITANTLTTVTATLSGGTDNDWDIGDLYTIGRPKDFITHINFRGGYLSLGTSQSTAFKFVEMVNATSGKEQAFVTMEGVSFKGGIFLLDPECVSKWEGVSLTSPTSVSDPVRFFETLPVAELVDPINTHDGANNAAALQDLRQNWVANELVGLTIYNDTDGSSGTITANTATTITATLAGGTDNDWDKADKYTVGGNGTPTAHIQNSWVTKSEMSDPHMTKGAIVTDTAATTATITTDRTTTHSNGISTRVFIPAAETSAVNLQRTCSDLTTATSGSGQTYLFFVRMKASAVMPLQFKIEGNVLVYETITATETKNDLWIDYVIKTSEAQTQALGVTGSQKINIIVTNNTGSDQEVWIDRIDYKTVDGDVYLP